MVLGRHGRAKLAVGACFLIGAAAIVLLTAEFSIGALLATVAVVGLGTSGTQTLIYGLVANYYRTNVRSAGVAWCAGFGRLGGVGGPILGGYPNRSPYCTAKWELIGFTKTLAIEFGGYGIRANAILPGAVDGPHVRTVFEGRAQASGRTVEAEAEGMTAIQSVKRLVDPKDIAALAVFLASDAGKCISGQMLPIDCDAQQAS